VIGNGLDKKEPVYPTIMAAIGEASHRQRNQFLAHRVTHLNRPTAPIAV
jgi:hypothetical protein